MSDSEATQHVHPIILARARELRRPLTPQEAKLWQRLRNKQLYGIKFRHQHPIFRFILDFFCYSHKLVIEIDGDSHAEPNQQLYDQARTEWLEQRGLHIIRFTNRDVDTNIEGVLSKIARQCGVEVGKRNSPQVGGVGGGRNPRLTLEMCFEDGPAFSSLQSPLLGEKTYRPSVCSAFPSYYQCNWLVAIALALAFIFTGTALAANNDRRPPTADRQSTPPFHFSSLILHAKRSSFSSPSTVRFARLPSTDDGAGLYQQWCSTCHGDRGQGLTEEWRATWPEGKQNCWQSKCHASNHPPDGFTFPKTVPALIGKDTLTKFNSARDLYTYTQARMPYWAPNLLPDQEYLAITAFLVEANYAEEGFPLPASWPQDLAAVPLHPTPAVGRLATWPVSTRWVSVIGLGILAALVVGSWVKLRFT